MREKIVVSRNHLFTQRLCAKFRCARKFSELMYLERLIAFMSDNNEKSSISKETLTIDDIKELKIRGGRTAESHVIFLLLNLLFKMPLILCLFAALAYVCRM